MSQGHHRLTGASTEMLTAMFAASKTLRARPARLKPFAGMVRL